MLDLIRGAESSLCLSLALCCFMAVMGACIPITLFQQFQDALELLVTFLQYRVEGL